MSNLLASNLKTYLLQDATITSYVSDRIFDYEIRGAGPASPSVFGPSGYTLPHIIIDDAGGTRAPLGPPAAFNDRLDITVIVENSSTGRTALHALTARLLVKLSRYQDPTTKQTLFYGDRSGMVVDPLPDTGAQERLTFGVVGTLTGVAT